MFEIDYAKSDKAAKICAVIAPCDKQISTKILNAARKSTHFTQSNAEKWLVFYRYNDNKFVASEIINEDENGIKKQIVMLVNKITPIANEFFRLIEAEYN